MVYKTNDSMLPWVCSEIDHRGRQNVVDLLNILQTWLECTFFLQLQNAWKQFYQLYRLQQVRQVRVTNTPEHK